MQFVVRNLARPASVLAVGAIGMAMAVAAHAGPGPANARRAIAHVAPQNLQLAVATTTFNHTGLVSVIVNVSLSGTVPPTQVVTCFVDISTSDASYVNISSSSSTLHRISQHVGTCVVNIPYDWTVASESDMVTASVTLTTDGAYGTEVVFRESGHTFVAFGIPASGTTTTLSLTDSL